MIELKSLLKNFIVLLFACTGMAISSVNVEGSEPLPREFKGVTLLMTPQEVKKALSALKVKFKERTDVDMGVPYSVLITRNLMAGIQIADFHFYEGKLSSIHLDHHLLDVPIPFELFLSALEENYGRPVEKELTTNPMFGYKTFIYLWRNEQTGLRVVYSPPALDPFGRPASGALNWTIYDKDLSEKEKKEREEKRAALKEKMKRK